MRNEFFEMFDLKRFRAFPWFFGETDLTDARHLYQRKAFSGDVPHSFSRK